MALAVQQVQFGFGARSVLRGVTCAFPAGTVTGIIGPNGAGKTTLLRLMLGVLEPAAGRVEWDGRDVTSVPRQERAAGLAYIPQRSSVAFPFSVREVVRLGRYMARRGENVAAVGAALERVDIADRADEPFGVLSAGQQQRVTVARALAQLGVGIKGESRGGNPRPRVLLADEPVSAMDPSHSLATLDLFATLAAEGLCVVVVLHDLNMLLRYVQRVVVLTADGVVAAEGSTAEVVTPARLSQVFGVGFRSLVDPHEPSRVAALIPQRST